VMTRTHTLATRTCHPLSKTGDHLTCRILPPDCRLAILRPTTYDESVRLNGSLRHVHGSAYAGMKHADGAHKSKSKNQPNLHGGAFGRCCCAGSA
jgi:hypothetical protein